jgi:transposase
MTRPAEHGLPGHGWTLKKLGAQALRTFGILAGHNSVRRVLRRAGLTWKKVKKLLGKAKPRQRAAHVEQLQRLFAAAWPGRSC